MVSWSYSSAVSLPCSRSMTSRKKSSFQTGWRVFSRMLVCTRRLRRVDSLRAQHTGNGLSALCVQAFFNRSIYLQSIQSYLPKQTDTYGVYVLQAQTLQGHMTPLLLHCKPDSARVP